MKLKNFLSRMPAFRICDFPPPYKSMLAFNGDVEWTSWPMQIALLKEFANRDLETAFSFWMFGSPKVTWRLLEDDCQPSSHAEGAAVLGRAGLLDTIHSIGGRLHQGGCDFSREDIRTAYKHLQTENWQPIVYTNHGSTSDRQNIGGKNWAGYQEGDRPESDLYHLDVTTSHGVRFFWCDPDYTIEKVSYKASVGKRDSLFVCDQGRDGRYFLRFRRWLGEGLPYGPSLDNLHIQMSGILDRKRYCGYTVVYQHLGVERDSDGKPQSAELPPLRLAAAEVLDHLSERQKAGDILVTTTSRLLLHAALMCSKPWVIERAGNGLAVNFRPKMQLGDVIFDLDPAHLAGWAIEVDHNTPVTAHLGGHEIEVQKFEKEGKSYAGFPWERLDMKQAIRDAEFAQMTRGRS